jgi:hypothetical protein
VQEVDIEVLLIFVALYALSAIINWWDLIKDTSVDLAIAVASIGALFVATWVDRHVKDRRRKRNACKAIIREIEDTVDGLDPQKNFVNRRTSNVFYTSVFLNADAYESVLHSGVFTEFEPETQNALSNFYINVKLRNELLKILSNYENMFFINDRTPERSERWISEALRLER